MEFLLNNITSVVMFLLVLAMAFELYLNYFKKNTEIDDNWLYLAITKNMILKNKKRHPNFVGSEIKLSNDKYYLVSSDGKIERIEK